MKKKIALISVYLLLTSIFTIIFYTTPSVLATPTASNVILWNKLEVGLKSEYGPNGWTVHGNPVELHQDAVFNDGSLFKGIQRAGFTLWGNQVAGQTPKWGQDEITIEFWAKPDIEALSNSYGDRYMFTFRKGSENAYGYIRIAQIGDAIKPEGICENPYSGCIISSNEFTHLAISISTSELKFYVNNELKYSSNLRSEVLNTYMPYEFLLGGGWQYNDWDWFGVIDNIKVFDYVKTDFSDRFVEDIIFYPDPISPIAEFSWINDGLNVDFTDLSFDEDGNIISWYWEFGDGETSSEQHPTHIYAEADDYTVTLTVTDNDGCLGYKPYTITVENTDPIFIIREIIEEIEGMDIKTSFKNKLIDTLENVIYYLENDRVIVALNSLNSFVNKIEAQRGKKLTVEQADRILFLVRKIEI